MSTMILKSAHIPGEIQMGTTLLYPTETVYGLGCRFDDAAALQHIYRLKGRESGVPVALICDTIEWVQEHFRIPAHAMDLMKAHWPGALAMLLKPKRPELFGTLVYQEHVGVRVSGLALARELATASGGALVSTSANLSGEPTPLSWQDCPASIRDGVSIIIDGGSLRPSEPSTLIRITEANAQNRGFDVIRQGSVRL